MDAKTYEKEALKTLVQYEKTKILSASDQALLNAVIGLSGEIGELTDAYKKYLFHGHKLDRDYVVKEAGDILWYVNLLLNTIGSDIETAMGVNIEKLRKRYGENFSVEKSLNREEYKTKDKK